MCGILGYFHQNLKFDFDGRFQDALELLHHRGPDDRGIGKFFPTSGKLFLGHTRLSIIDLSSGGHQPMHTLDGRYSIVFNGEIYNYRELRYELKELGHTFETDCDTEVLLYSWVQWGAESFRRLIGMFAFAIFDNVRETLTLVRDAFGIKPLFYAIVDGDILFASEMSALIKLRDVSPQLNTQRAYDYLLHGIQDSGADTFVQGIYHVPPAHWLQFDLRRSSRVQPQCWWMPSILETCKLSFSDAAEQLRQLFLDSVRFHLRSDVPLGVALSGGIDSSAIACCARYLNPAMVLHTFSYISSDATVSEEYWIDQVNTHINAVEHKVRVSSAELEADIQDLIFTQGEPFCTTSMYAQYRIFRAAQAVGMKVVLEGQGGDELLAGYHGYQGQRMHSLWERKKWLTMYRFAKQWRQWPGREELNPWRAFGGRLLPDFLYQFVERMLNLKKLPSWMNSESLQQLDRRSYLSRFDPIPSAKGRRVMEVLLHSMKTGGLPSLLRYGDRNAMRFSVENRVPFLTLPLVEFVFSLPEQYLIAENGETKSLFRAAMRGIVPDELLNRRDKIGFETPMGNLVSGLLSEVNKSKSLSESGLVNVQYMQKHLEDCRKNIGSFTAQMWRLMNLSLWMQRNLDEELNFE